jgi:hypothetical protein
MKIPTLDRLKETADALNEIATARSSNNTRDLELVQRSVHARKESTLDAAQDSHELHKTLSNTTSEILVDLNDTNITLHTFDAPDPMLFASRLFHHGRVQPDPNATYGTTIGLIVLLHVVFLFQWNKRKTRRNVLATYHQLVRRKQFHRSIVAVVSHPPADPLTLRERSTLAIDMGDSSQYGGRPGRLRNGCKSLVEFLQPVSFGHLSGLPLLTYNSHLLWSCRALEALCPSPYYYARFLVALTIVACLCELRITDNLLQTTRAVMMGMRIGLGGGGGISAPTQADAQRRTLLHRTMGTPTMLTSALLLVNYFCFPYVAIPILPFLPVSRRVHVSLSYFTCFTLLLALSWKSHPVTSVMCGTFSGFLWVSGITSFFGDVYWGTVMIVWLVFACLLSLRGTPQLAAWVPCIDYVAWDARGRIRFDGLTVEPEQEEEEEEQDEAVPVEDDIESRPLLIRRTESLGLRGRVPMMDMDDDIEMPTRASETIASPRGLSQRRSGVSDNPTFHRD